MTMRASRYLLGSRFRGGFLGGCGRSGGAFLRLLLRLGLFRIVAGVALADADALEQAGDAIGRGRALGDPGLRLLGVDHETVGGEKAKEWIAKGATPTDRVARLLETVGVGKREARSNPDKAKPKKKAQERAAAAAAAAEKAAAAAE